MGADIGECLIPATLLLGCVFGGAFSRGFKAPRMVLVVKAASVVCGVVSILLSYGYAVDATGAAREDVVLLGMLVSVGSVFLSLWLVEFGERIGDRAGIAREAAVQDASKATEASLSGILDGFNARLNVSLTSTTEAVQRSVSSTTDSLDRRMKALEAELAGLRKELATQGTRYGSLFASYDTMAGGYNRIVNEYKEQMETVRRETESLRDERERLRALRETYERLTELLEERTASAGDNTPKEGAVLTSEDREASRRIGREAEREFAEYFRDEGFESVERVGEGDPDLVLKSHGKVAAMVNTKSYMLYDEPKRNQRRIGLDDVIPETAAATRLKAPLLLAVKNRRNGRVWLCLVSPEELKDWKGTSTPLILSKDDPESGKQLQEMVQDVLGKLRV
jgi:Holliday junction resolvase/prefoldin subunit 5